ncbi:DNA repair protein RadA [Thermomonospora curvata]|uniref:DNA repair protein RadA n=1 Tax=Thermomonospora curvata (strain ATCC 19995 / DSM 43183 / JCM 3096 / KCTC 9072 / NBRC 15933 / NCIMB 10081 / Henssen B9) TaxID=471852 RepID=D1A4B9_THECD|nr:DNA repair protein RadA [Thermomonospora curvata]ACY99993.1 DNA repair protein RadA [Thermomonospora curvata DSM 43183]
MAKAKTGKPAYRCTECGWQTSKWVGRCGECQAWGTVSEAGAAAPPRVITAGPVSAPARPIGEVDVQSAQMQPTGLDELDRVLGGGMVPGAVLLLAGEPGIGKSTLLLEVAALAAARTPVLYVTGEESAEQVRLRADRVGAVTDGLYLAAETELSTVLGHVEEVEPKLLVVDSIQTIGAAEVEGAPGGVTQIREVTANLIRVAKERSITTVLVGHVTKDGAIAGPRLLEHLVDVVLYFEGDRHSRLRMIRAVKNRYGPTDELGCFDLSEVGIVGLADPSGLFLTRREEPVPGTCVTVTLEGRRPLVAEVQALVAKSFLPAPRRATSGLDASRVAMVLAVLSRRCQIAMHDQDVYVSTVGGVRLAETSVDLAVALAVAGSTVEQPLSPNVIALGEVGLAGEVRAVPGVPRRLAEAGRLGFKSAVVPKGSLELGEASPLRRAELQAVSYEGMRVMEVDNLNQALQVAFTAP